MKILFIFSLSFLASSFFHFRGICRAFGKIMTFDYIFILCMDSRQKGKIYDQLQLYGTSMFEKQSTNIFFTIVILMDPSIRMERFHQVSPFFSLIFFFLEKIVTKKRGLQAAASTMQENNGVSFNSYIFYHTHRYSLYLKSIYSYDEFIY